MITKESFIDSIKQPLFDPEGKVEVFGVYLMVEDDSLSIWEDSKGKKYIYGSLAKTEYSDKGEYDKALASLKKEMWEVAKKEMFPHSMSAFNIWKIEPMTTQASE